MLDPIDQSPLAVNVHGVMLAVMAEAQTVRVVKHCGFKSISRREAAVLFGVSARMIQAQATVTVEKIDLIPVFLRCWTDLTANSPQIWARRFVDQVVTPHAELFSGFTGEVTVERAAQYLDRVESLVGDIRTLHKWIAEGFDGKLDDFRKHLPDFKWSGSIVFMPTLFGFDAGGGQMNGKSYLIFGLDTIAKVYGPNADLSVLFAHEFFHLYHGSFHQPRQGEVRGRTIPLFRLVWTEGLATYASQQLNPGAGLAAIFLSPTLASSCEGNLKALSTALLQDLDSTERGPVMEWMSGQTRISDVPPRAGYYFGWRVAQSLGREMSLPQLARLTDNEVHKAILTELRSLASSQGR